MDGSRIKSVFMQQKRRVDLSRLDEVNLHVLLEGISHSQASNESIC